MTDLVVIDIEALWSNQKSYVIKEIAIVTKHEVYAARVQSPKNIKSLVQTNKWLKKFRHNIDWEDEGVPFFIVSRNISRMIRPGVCIKAKGKDKCDRLSHILGINIENVEDTGCPKINSSSALDKAFEIYTWCRQLT